MADNSFLSRDEQRQIAWSGMTLFERMDIYEQTDGLSFDQTGRATDEVDDFSTEWATVVADGERRILTKRLLAENISEQTYQKCLLQNTWPESVTIPAWVNELNDLIAYVEQSSVEVDDEATFPFEDVLSPFVDYGYETLLTRTNLQRLSPTAVTSTKEWLLTRLTEISVEALHVEFSTFRLVRKPSIYNTDRTDGQRASTTLYTAFVENMHTSEKLRSFFTEYSVLARLVMTTIRQWTAAIKEFHHRLNQDWSDIRTTFSTSDNITVIADLDVLTDDRHRDGRAVIRAILPSDDTVLYKPRSIETEDKYGTLIDEIADRAGDSLKTPVCLSNDEYGWVEWIPSIDCTTVDEVHRYYRRAGMLLGISYMTYLNDCHFENVVAQGAHPVIVDTETILHPLLNSDEGISLAEDETIDSVMWTGLLPRKLASPTGEGEVNIGGFQVPTLPVKEDLSNPQWWVDMNSDTMAVAEQEPSFIQLDNATNVPRLHGTVETPDEYVDAIKSGFEQVYAQLTADPSILSILEGLETRVLFGQTYTYTSILDAITAPAALRSGEKVTLHLEHLIAERSFDGDYGRTKQQIYKAERTALLRLDVPRFTVAADGIQFNNTYISEPAYIPGWERVTAKMQSLSENDLAKQRDYIQTACVSETPPVMTDHSTSSMDSRTVQSTDVPTNMVERYLHDIPEQILQHATDDQEGHMSWIIRTYSNNRWLDIQTSGNGVYTGRAGIAIFLALLHKFQPRRKCHAGAIDALIPLRKTLHRSKQSASHLGNSDGIGSQIYALSKVGQLLDRPQVVDDAELAAEQLTADRIQSDEAFDVMNGCAGALLSLVALYNLRPQEWIVRKAIACGEHLLQHRIDTDTPYRAWESSLGPHPLTGMSHGTAGIAYALYRLFDVCGDDRFRRAGAEGLRYERTTYSSEHHNWPDLRGESPTYLDAWCYGRSGIGLSRLGIAAITETPLVHEDITNALPHTTSTCAGFPDQLCCGNAGRIDCLLRAADYTNDRTYMATANRLLNRLLQRADETQCFALPGHTRTLYNPSLFMGTAGIGYILLRQKYGTDVPCLLLWE